ncbi:hypothetical protein [Actibacterium sp. D379-3]
MAITTFFNEALGVTETVYSNQVEAIVAAAPAIEVTGYSDLRLSRGAVDQHYFEISNTGNTDLNTQIRVDTMQGAGLIEGTAPIWDQNANGLADAGEPEILPGQSQALAIGQSMHLIYSFTTSPAATPGDVAISELSLVPVSVVPGAEVAGNTTARGQVIIAEGGFEIQKSVARRSTAEGEELTYTLRLRNNSEAAIAGYDAIDGNTIRIDGTPRTGVLIHDAVPLNTRFVSAGYAGGLDALFHLRADAPQSFVSTPPADPGQVDAVAFFWEGDYPVGKSTDMRFTVLLPAALGDVTVRNTAETFVASATGTQTVTSNEVVLRYTAAVAATLAFNGESGALGSDTVLRLTSGACNVSSQADAVEITVSSRLTGDAETVIARETGPNTGIFATGPLPLSRMGAPVVNDGVMASDDGDELDAVAQCGGLTVAASLPVNPGNFVFNSVTNEAVTDAVVNLVNSAGTIVATATSDRRGYFSIGAVPAGEYRFEVEPPRAFSFASIRLSFPGYGRRINDEAAFGLPFQHDGGGVYLSDIPVDPYYGVPLALEKTADKSTVRTGEAVVYSLTAQNNMDQALVGAEIVDRPPFGAELIAGSVLLDGKPWPDPVKDAGGDHVFALGNIKPLETRTLTYVLRYTPLARDGRNYNSAVLSGRQAGTGEVRVSGVSSAFVKLDNSGGVFSREGTIIGSVFMDCNGNGLRDGVQEPGVPGVKIVTQEGLFVVTDIDGKYSLFGLRPVSHVLSLMSKTLPEGAYPVATRTSDMMRGGTRLVDLKRGELRAERFALTGCTPAVLAAVSARADRFAERGTGGGDLLTDLPIDGSRAETRSARSEAGLATATQIYGAEQVAGTAPATDLAQKVRQTATEAQSLEGIIKTLSPDAGFIGLANGDKTARRSLTVQVKGPADLTLALMLNGEEVPATRIGEKSTWPGGNVQALTFVALQLRAGKNTLALIGKDPFGNERARQEITLVAPGDPARIEIVAPETAPASPGTVVPVVVRILDAAGTPVEASATVTLRARNATWDVTDIRPERAGVQAFIDNGEATFGLLAPQVSGTDLIEVSSTFGKAEASIMFTPDLEERILVGVIEGAVALNGRGDLIDSDMISPFEDTASGLRGELYLKGRIRGDALLTLRYSSDRDTDAQLFRDIRGDEYYPVYGDNSERGFDAQSSTKLFIKVEKGQSYVLYGDIAIEPEADAFQLGGYNRLTTGAKAHWQNDKVSVSVFAAHTAQRQQVVELPGRGISGPYDVDLSNYREGSDRVDILVRDRDTGEIISEQAQRRLTDYVLDFFRNTIVFNAPVAQADADGNPVSIRFTYETEGDTGARHWLYGGEVSYQATERTAIGVRIVRSDANRMTAERERIIAAYLQTRIGEKTMLEAEAAQSENGFGEKGSAARISLVHAGDTARLSIEAVHTGNAFNPSGSSTAPGTDRLSVDYDIDLGDESGLSVEADYIADRIAGTQTAKAEIEYERRLNDQATGRVGLRVDHDFKADGDATRVFGLLGATWTPETDRALVFDAEVVQPVYGTGEGHLRFGMDYAFRPGWNLRAEAEFAIGREEGRETPTHLLLAMDYQVTDWLTGRSQFSAEDEGLTRSRFVQGFKGDWTITEQLSLGVGVEHSEPVSGDDDWLTSVNLGAKWSSDKETWVAEADFDQTFEANGNTSFASLGIAGQVSPDLTVMLRSRHAIDGRGDGPAQMRHRTRAGLAYRPAENPRLAVLAWYERRIEEKAQKTESHEWSLAASYETSPDLELNAKYAGQSERISLGNSGTVTSLTQLIQAGLAYDFADDRFRIGLNGMRLWDNKGHATGAVGVELGYVVNEGSMLSIGFNKSAGWRPQGPSFYQEGIYLRLRLLLDDSLWDKLRLFGGN